MGCCVNKIPSLEFLDWNPVREGIIMTDMHFLFSWCKNFAFYCVHIRDILKLEYVYLIDAIKLHSNCIP